MLDLAQQLAGKIEDAERALEQETVAAARLVVELDKPALDFCRRLLAIIRVVLDEEKASIPGGGWHGIVMSILTKVIATVRAAHALTAAGHVREVSVLVRAALEALITALFIAKEDSALRAKRWVQFADIQKAILLKGKLDPALAAPEFRAERRRILARARRLRKLKHFPSKFFWAAGLKKGTLRDLAEDVGMLWHYEMVYWSGSQGTHTSAIDVASYVGVSSGGAPVYNMGFSVESLHGDLAVCCEVLVRALDLISRLCEFDLTNLGRSLIAEYKAALDRDPGPSLRSILGVPPGTPG
jgi:Family of unknown function (DUF5677)